VPVVTLIEDDDRIRQALRAGLADKGYVVRSASTGMAGLGMVTDDPGDVVVLDLGLPDVEGRKLLRMLRAVTPIPVIVATARDDESEIVQTLDAGADDYVVKPFSAAQLDARIRALLRRVKAGENSTAIVIGDLSVDPRAREATLEGRLLGLSRKEFDLLHYLAARAGTVVGKREILAEVWRLPFGGTERTVDVHLSWLRRKLGETAANPRYLRVVRGVGAQLVDPRT
jgi:two-component system, OmpR family, KDP operon response regulator KdpE